MAASRYTRRSCLIPMSPWRKGWFLPLSSRQWVSLRPVCGASLHVPGGSAQREPAPQTC